MDKVRAEAYEKELTGKEVGGWMISSKLGNGASAVVFSAEKDGQQAAVKVFDRELVERFGEEQEIARIKLELKLVGKKNDHLVQIFDGGKCEKTGLLFVVMEKLDLKPLSTRVADFPVERIRPLIVQIADAARFLESVEPGLVHRDIKPENIVVTEDLERAVLLDFGVLHPLEPNAAEDRGSGQEFLATIRYSSPEYLMRQEDGSPDGWRALTFYQIGGVLHNLIMRKPLFAEFGPPRTRLTDAVRWQRPAIDNPAVPADLQELARNCLEKDWRTRLELVRWSDFSATGRSSFDLPSVKDRIRRRRAAAALSGAALEAPDLRAQSEGALANARDLVVATVREIREKTQNFPPLRVIRDSSGSEFEARICFAMGPDQTFSLNHCLKIFVCVQLLSRESIAFRIRVHCTCAGRGDSWPDGVEWTDLFAGSADAALLAQRFDELFHFALDQAQSQSAGSAIDLPVWREV
jgi:serine/threonine protein kinase